MSIEKKIVKPAEKEFGEKMGNYWIGPIFSAQKKIQLLTDRYKKNYLKKMISLDPRELDPGTKGKKEKRLPDELIISVKRDGGYYLYFYDEHTQPISIFCNSPNGRALYNLPVSREIDSRIENVNKKYLNEFKTLFNKFTKINFFEGHDTICNIILAGELYANVIKEGDRPRVFDLVTILRNPQGLEDLERICYDIFDLISINGIEILAIPYERRLEILEFLFPKEVDHNAKTIENEKNVKSVDVHKFYRKWVEQENQEGLVIRTKFNMLYKVKKVFDIDAVIIGFVEMLEEKTSKGESAVSSFLLALMRSDGMFQELSRMGGGLTEDQRIDLYKLIKDDLVDSDFKASKSDGRAYHFVKPKYIVQIKYMDIVTEGALGEAIRRMALKFENNKWTPLKNVPFVSLISPRFDIMRSIIDKNKYPSLEYVNPKEVKYEDLKIEQVLDLTLIDTLETVEELENLPKSKILFKVVFEGKWAGELSAHKILIWATNKRTLNLSYPNYIVYDATYNHSRTQPLEQEIYPFNTFEKAIKHLNWIFKRPDNPSEGLLDTSGTKLKGSIIAKPYKLEVDKDHEIQIIQGLDPLVRGLLFEEKAVDELLEEILDLSSSEKQKVEKIKTPKKKTTTAKKVPEKSKEEKLLEEILDLDSSEKEETAEKQKVEKPETPKKKTTTAKKETEKDKDKKVGKKDILDEILDMNLDDIDFDKK